MGMGRKRDTLNSFTSSRDILKNTPEYGKLIEELQTHIDALTEEIEEEGDSENNQETKTGSISLTDVLIYAGIATVVAGAIATAIFKLRRH